MKTKFINTGINQLKIILRDPLSLFFIAFFTGCNFGSFESDKSARTGFYNAGLTEEKDASVDSAICFLLNASASDFINLQSPVPVAFRDVRIGHLLDANDAKIYILCGQFLSQNKQDNSEWISFATIKTSGYEQWIGAQALAYYEATDMKWYKIEDLSSVLKRRFDFLKYSRKDKNTIPL